MPKSPPSKAASPVLDEEIIVALATAMRKTPRLSGMLKSWPHNSEHSAVGARMGATDFAFAARLTDAN
jgi:hypothetical protein